MTLLSELADALGPSGCLTGSQIPDLARSDWSGTGRHLPVALLRPASVAEVSAALSICHRHDQAVVPQGGMTGLAGGANPRAGDVALSMVRFSGIEELDVAAATMTVRAGTVLQVAQIAAAEAGFLLPIDLGSRGSCQIGGNVATNAGGLRVIRHGMTRDNLLGLEVVLADGTVISSLCKMIKNNTGYDLPHLFAGSEGTLGIVTRVVLRLRPLPRHRATALCALRSYDGVMRLLEIAQKRLTVSAFEAMWRDYIEFNQRTTGAAFFSDAPSHVVLLEAEGSVDSDEFDHVLAEALAEDVISDALVAQSEAEARRFWKLREGVGIDASLPKLMNFDVGLPIGQMDQFATACREELLARFPQAHTLFFGHVADGNLHIAFAHAEPGVDNDHDVDRIVYDLVRSFKGSISAEHGIGVLKRDWLGHSRSSAELTLMKHLKSALDPKWMMNPGKML